MRTRAFGIDETSLPSRLPRSLRRAWKLIVVILVIATLIVTGLYIRSEYEYYSCRYTMLAQSSSDAVFTLYVPVPTNGVETAFADLAEEGRITGASSYELVNTSHGNALMISGAGSIKVEWSSSSTSSIDSGYFCGITMFNGSLNLTTGMQATWIFCDDPDVSVYLGYDAGHRRQVSLWYVSGSSNQYELLMPSGTVGWRSVATEYEGVIYN